MHFPCPFESLSQTTEPKWLCSFLPKAQRRNCLRRGRVRDMVVLVEAIRKKNEPMRPPGASLPASDISHLPAWTADASCRCVAGYRAGAPLSGDRVPVRVRQPRFFGHMDDG